MPHMRGPPSSHSLRVGQSGAAAERNQSRSVTDAGGVNARIAAVRRGGRVDAALGACRTDLRIMWRPLLVIRVSQLVSRAADHR